jgi:hypothetical protein
VTHATKEILLLPLVMLLCCGGLLLWPLRRWLKRRRDVRGRALWFIFLAQCISSVALLFLVDLRPQPSGSIEHSWVGRMIQLNIFFIVAGLVAWARDAYYEATLDSERR